MLTLDVCRLQPRQRPREAVMCFTHQKKGKAPRERSRQINEEGLCCVRWPCWDNSDSGYASLACQSNLDFVANVTCEAESDKHLRGNERMLTLMLKCYLVVMLAQKDHTDVSDRVLFLKHVSINLTGCSSGVAVHDGRWDSPLNAFNVQQGRDRILNLWYLQLFFDNRQLFSMSAKGTQLCTSFFCRRLPSDSVHIT